jgi:hypothetical protein
MIPIALAGFALAASLVATPPAELTPRTIGPAAYTQSQARFAFDGTRFLAVWTHQDGVHPPQIHGAYLDAKGARVDTNTMLIASEGFSPAVAYGGGKFLVVWATNSSGSFAKFINPGGTLQTFATGINAAPGSLRVAFNNEAFLITGTDGPSLRANLLEHSLGAFTVMTKPSGFSVQPELVATGGTFQVISPMDDGRIVAIEIGGLASVAEPRTLATVGEIDALHAAARGSEVRVAWRREPSIESVTMTPSSVTTEAPIFVGSRAFQELAADTNGYVYFYGDDEKTISRRIMPYDVTVPPGTVVHDALSNGTNLILLLDEPQGDVYAGSLTTQDYFVVSTAIATQTWPDVALAGDQLLTVWLENDRLLADGVDVHATTPKQPHVATNGFDFLVVWIDGNEIRGARIAQSGALIDQTPIHIANGGLYTERVAVAWDGHDYVVVFDRTSPGRPPSSVIQAVRVGANGHVATHETPIGSSPNVELAIASSGNGSLIVWQAGTQISGALLSQTDLVTPVTFPDPAATAADVAWNGDTYAVVYTGGTSLHELRWAFVSAAGSVRAPFVSFPTTSARAAAHIAPFADRFLVVFRDPVRYTQLEASRLQALTFDRDGEIVEQRTILDSADAGFALAGPYLVTSRPIASTPAVSRLFLRELRSVPSERTRSVRH